MKIDETREKILKVASRIFGQYGFYRSTMDEVARTAHKAKGSIYYYFTNKEDLFKEVVVGEMDILKSSLQQLIREDKTATEMIKSYFLVRMDVMRRCVNYQQMLRADFAEKFEFLNEARRDLDIFEVSLLTKILQKAVIEQNLEIHDVEKSAQVIVIAIKAFEVPLFLQNKIDEYEQTVIELLNLIFKGLGKS
jgi:AcrR family transcriptional regulator